VSESVNTFLIKSVFYKALFCDILMLTMVVCEWAPSQYRQYVTARAKSCLIFSAEQAEQEKRDLPTSERENGW